MKFLKGKSSYRPPTQGVHRHIILVEDGPTWEEGRKRKVRHTIVKVNVYVTDDGTTRYDAYEQRVKVDGSLYDENPRRVWVTAAIQGRAAEAANEVIEQLKRDEIQAQL